MPKIGILKLDWTLAICECLLSTNINIYQLSIGIFVKIIDKSQTMFSIIFFCGLFLYMYLFVRILHVTHIDSMSICVC